MDLNTIDELIASSQPRHRGLRGSMLILLGLSLFLGAMWADPGLLVWSGPLGSILPQVVLVLMVVLVIRNTLRQRQKSRLMETAFEAVQLKDWLRAEEALNQLLRRPIRYTLARAESLLALAAVHESRRDYPAAQRIYEGLLEENSADPLQLHAARVSLAAVMLRNGQTTDAVDLIERLERIELPDALRAQVELVALFREVAMGQAEASIARAEERRELFRQYLSTRAAYGYGLLAAAFDRVAKEDTARAFWRDATLLVQPAQLTARFDELAGVAAKYPAAEFAL